MLMQDTAVLAFAYQNKDQLGGPRVCRTFAVKVEINPPPPPHTQVSSAQADKDPLFEGFVPKWNRF